MEIINGVIGFNRILTCTFLFFVSDMAVADQLAQIKIPEVGEVGSIAYVSASTANVREQAKPNSRVMDKLVTNTGLTLISKNGSWCEVEVKPESNTEVLVTTELSKTKHKGFVACNLLSSQKLSMEMVDAQIEMLQGQAAREHEEMYKRYNENPQDGLHENHIVYKQLLDWASKAFWISPSLTRWQYVGSVMENALLSTEERNKQYEEQKPKRFTVPEFEAMKKKLSEGVVVASSTIGLHTKMDITRMAEYLPSLKSANERIKLPKIQPSFFKGMSPLVLTSVSYGGLGQDTLGAMALIDTLSAYNKIAYKATGSGQASYALNIQAPMFSEANSVWRMVPVSGAMEVIVGIWDVSELKVIFDREPVLNGITQQGKTVAQYIKGIDISVGYDSSCSYSSSQIKISKSDVPGYSSSANVWLSWAGKPIPGGETGKANIKTRQYKGDTPVDLVVASEVDLDGDGVPDFLIWKGRYQPQVSAEGLWETVFANVDGKWVLLRFEQDADCT